MSFGSALHLATFLTAGSAFAAAAVGGNLNPLFTAAWIVAFLMAALTPEGRFKGGIVIAVGVLTGPALAAAVVSAVLDPVLAAVYFSSLLLLARLLTRAGTEGHAQVHLLSILVLAGGAAISPDLTYLLVFVVYLFSLTFALLLVHLRREAGESATALPVRELVGRGLFNGTVALAVFAMAFTSATFLLFPRATFGIGMARVAGAQRVGLTDRIELAGFGRIKEDERVVLRVWSDEAAKPPDTLDIYWRAQALEIYDGLGWTATERILDAQSSSSIRFDESDETSRAYPLDVEVVSALGVPVLPIPDQARAVRVGHRDSRGSRISLRRAGGREVRTVGIPSPPYDYRVEVYPGTRVVDESPPGPEHLEISEQHPAIVALANRLAEEAGTGSMALAEVMERWLSTRFSYSVDLPRDPSLEHFLLERQSGHCEYFATAMVVLLRLRGVPARVVVGFQGGRWNASGGYHVVRQNEAHAWVEAWHEGIGWLRYEPTPPAGIGRGIAPLGLRERLADLWDSLQSSWAQNVLSFDRTLQRDLFRNVARAFDDLGRAFERDGGRREGLLRAMGWLLGGLMLLTGSIFLLRRRRRSGGKEGGLSMDARRARKIYREFVRALRGAGIERGVHQTSEEVLDSIRLVMPSHEEAVLVRASEIIWRYDASRFGGHPLPAEEARALTKEARRVARAVESSCR